MKSVAVSHLRVWPGNNVGLYVVVTAASLTVTLMRRTPLKSHWLVRLDSFTVLRLCLCKK